MRVCVYSLCTHLECVVEALEGQREDPSGLHSVGGAAVHSGLEQVADNSDEVLEVAGEVGGRGGEDRAVTVRIHATGVMLLNKLVVLHCWRIKQEQGN